MSDKSDSQGRDGRRSGSSSARSTRANSVASEDNSAADQRGATVGSSASSKKSSSVVSSTTSGRESGGELGVGSRDRLRYSYEFLKKLQKSKLSRKPPECVPKLRQENILRETWRNDKDDKKDNGDREVQLDLGMTRRSFVAGCQIANIQLSEGSPKPTSKLLGHQVGGKDSAQGSGQSNGNGNTNSAGKDSNGATPAAVNRRIGSGRLDRTFKDTRSDRDRDYGYGTNDRDRDRGDRDQGRRRGAFDFRHNSRGSDLKGRRYDLGSREDEPEWFTEGPTSQTETIELGGFDDARSGMPRDSSTNNNSSGAANSSQTPASSRDRKQPAYTNRSQMTPSPDQERRKKSWSEKELLLEFASTGSNSGPKRESPSSCQDDLDDNDKPLQRDDFDGSSHEDEGAPITFENFFLNSGEEPQAELRPDEQRQSLAMLGSRFMMKVFSKAPMSPSQRGESPRVASPDHHDDQHEPSESQHRPLMEILRAPTPQEVPPPGAVAQSPGGPPFLRELMQMSHHPQSGGGDMVPAPAHMNMIGNHNHHHHHHHPPPPPHPHPNNGVGGMMGMVPPGHGPPGPLEALLGVGSHHGGLPLQPPMHHTHPHGMPNMPLHGPPMEHMNHTGSMNNKMANCDNGPTVTSGRELLEMLLMGASASGAPSPPPPPPQHAKTVEELEAEFKMNSSRPMMHHSVQQQQPQQGHLNHGPHGGNSMPMERTMHAGMPHHTQPMDRPHNGLVPLLGEMRPHGHIPIGPMGHHFPPGPSHMAVHHPAQQPNHNAGQDIMRILTEGTNRGDTGHGRGIEPAHTKPAFKQDLKNVPTQVLLREKDLVIQREPNSIHGAPRPIVKSNKSNTPPGPPPPAMPTPQPHENGAEFLSKFLQQHQQQQQQQQQQPPPSQQHQQPPPPTASQQQLPLRAHHGPGGTPYFGGNGHNVPSHHNQNNNSASGGAGDRGNGHQSAGSGNSKIIRGGNPPSIPSHQAQPLLALEELFASAGQAGQQQDGRLVLGGPNMPRPLTGVHGQRYGEMGQYGPPQPLPMQQVQPTMKSQNSGNDAVDLPAHNPFAKWFGEGFPAADSPALPRNVVRVEDLERQQQRFHQKLPAI